MTIRISEIPFDPWMEVSQQHSKRLQQKHDCGATSVFVGTMRDFNENSNVSSMFLEHYPGMTESQLEQIVNQAEQRWVILDTLIIHRVGDIYPADAIVLVAIWASHRGDAFDASRFIMEELKHNAPFWKKETLGKTENSRWVAGNTDGYTSIQTGKTSS
ncbi:MAG: molybdenum cofactor biosynthesis protein MoaE [Methylococcales bacterium]